MNAITGVVGIVGFAAFVIVIRAIVQLANNTTDMAEDLSAIRRSLESQRLKEPAS